MNELMRRRRALMGQKKAARLPADFQEVSWIEGKNGPVINSGVKIKTDSLLLATVEEMGDPAYPYPAFYGSENPIFYLQHQRNSTNYYVGFGTSLTVTANATLLRGGPHTIAHDKTGVKIDGEQFATFSNKSVTENENVFLFGISANTRPTWARIYSLQIIENGSMVRDFVPCYRKADNEIGMFDLVSNTFFTNAGTGTFTKGADVQ